MDVSFGVLGPLVAGNGRGPLALPGPRHRAVLARLLVARGRVVPVDALVDALWPQPRPGAVGALQTFVATLRRALEPDRAPRTPARLLVTEAPGYALRLPPDAVDAWRFEAAVRSGAGLEAALSWWRGPAYAEFADEPWARPEAARLEELRLVAVERRAAAWLDEGRAAEAAADLESHVDAHRWREEAWRLLALALYRTGRQGDALGALRRARAALASDLGVDPGPQLRALEQDILAQAPKLAAGSRRPPVELAGRAEELSRLDRAAADVEARGRLGLVLVSGDAGAGKTALAEVVTDRLAARGWTTAWGASPDRAGVPAAWPWTRILAALGGSGPEPGTAEDPAVARFHWHRAVARRLADGPGRLLLVLDDLHWAGEETLALLAAVVAEPVARPVLVIATYRTTDVSPELTELLGRVARAEPVRLYLGGLALDAVARLVGPDNAAVVHRRSGGNPFFVRELGRVLDAEGGLPEGVRDVVRYRVARLPEAVRAVLRRAAVLGTDVDLDLLGTDDGTLDAVEIAAERGFLTERGPRAFRFAHSLVRDAVYEDLSLPRRARLHAQVAEALERLRPEDPETLAHHFVRAGSARGVPYARAAAERAEQRFAPHEAARLWRSALELDRGDVELHMGLARSLAFAGALGEARRHRAEALTLAGGDRALTVRVLTAFDVPGVWTENDDPELARRVADAVERVLPGADRRARCHLLATLALELRNTGGERARAAAREAEALARELNDPALLAFALNARWMQAFDRAGLAPERAGIGTELVALAERHGLVTFEVLGHLILVQARSALADFAAADTHAAAADRLGETYDLPLVGVLTQWYRALRAAVTGRPAEAAYRAAAARLSGTGMSGVDDGILALALLGLGKSSEVDSDFGGYAPWCRPAGEIPDSPRDLLFEARTCLHAAAAIEAGDRAAAERLYDLLLPAAGELAGAGSGLVTFGPVADHLAELAEVLGRDATAHRRQAAAVRARVSRA
ncbi:BTAD domain-containing putative transcriptional regulator [Amycolatopsis sp. PS_44_ISF1]|uniref:BTAD domain-containing putative transcriptional regulator n=1 Tax=Amycolatopsis sp. PS_44_ISF1 TaxID=2974917 RepID=UPI0028DF025C|nr:BTAD domain-containing putative transcriptional regulator [Amycolatopsis sp. PS_44_ISF1]MDT8909500.1 AAA family ATPase [Amycolatopsis sp. PS_44_ISF1]